MVEGLNPVCVPALQMKHAFTMPCILLVQERSNLHGSKTQHDDKYYTFAKPLRMLQLLQGFVTGFYLDGTLENSKVIQGGNLCVCPVTMRIIHVYVMSTRQSTCTCISIFKFPCYIYLVVVNDIGDSPSKISSITATHLHAPVQMDFCTFLWRYIKYTS